MNGNTHPAIPRLFDMDMPASGLIEGDEDRLQQARLTEEERERIQQQIQEQIDIKIKHSEYNSRKREHESRSHYIVSRHPHRRNRGRANSSESQKSGGSDDSHFTFKHRSEEWAGSDYTGRRNRHFSDKSHHQPRTLVSNGRYFLRGITADITYQDLSDYFKQFGPLVDVAIIRSKKIGYIEYGEASEMGEAKSYELLHQKHPIKNELIHCSRARSDINCSRARSDHQQGNKFQSVGATTEKARSPNVDEVRGMTIVYQKTETCDLDYKEEEDPLNTQVPNRRYFLRGITDDITYQDLSGYFKQFGPLVDVAIIRSKKIGYIEFGESGEMVEAKREDELVRQKHLIKNEHINCSIARSGPKQGYGNNPEHTGAPYRKINKVNSGHHTLKRSVRPDDSQEAIPAKLPRTSPARTTRNPFNIQIADKKVVSHIGTQVVTSNFTDCCWVCGQKKCNLETETAKLKDRWKARLLEERKDELFKKKLIEKDKKSENDLAQVRGKYQELVKKLNRLNKSVKENDAKAAKVLAEEKRQRHIQLEENKTLVTEVTKLKDSMKVKSKEFQEKADVWKTQLAEAVKGKEEATKKTMNSDSDLAQGMSKMTEYKNKLKQVEADCQQKLQNSAKEMTRQQRDKQNNLTRKLATAQQEVTNLKKKWEDSEKEVGHLKQIIQLLGRQHEGKQQDLTKKLNTSQREVGEAQNKLEDSEKQVHDLNQEIESLRLQLEGKEQELTRKLAASQQEVCEAQNKRDNSDKQMRHLNQRIQSLRQQHEDKQQDLCRKLAAAQQEVSHVQNKRKDLEKQLRYLNQAKESLRQHEGKQQDLTRKLHASQQEVSDAQNKREDLEKQLRNLTEAIQLIKQQHEDKQQDLMKKLGASQQEANDLQNKRKDSEKQLRNLKQRIQSLGHQHEGKQQDFIRKLNASQQEIIDAQNKQKTSEKQAQDVNQVLVNLRIGVFDLLSSLIDKDDMDLDSYVKDPKSKQVDDFLKRVHEDNSL